MRLSNDTTHYIVFDSNQAKFTSNENPTSNPNVMKSKKQIVGKKGNYGIGVYLDDKFLDNLTDSERVQLIKEYVNELGGQVFNAFDSNGNIIDVKIATSRRFKNKNGARVPANKDLKDFRKKNIKNVDKVRQESMSLINELIETADTSVPSTPSKYTHGWLDDNAKNNWDHYFTYVVDKKGGIWKVIMSVANTDMGEKVLYDLSVQKKKVDRVVKPTHVPLNNNIPTPKKSVNNNSTLSMKSKKDSQGRTLTPDQIKYFENSKVRDENGNLKVMYHGTSGKGFKVFDESFNTEGVTGFFFTGLSS